MRKNISTETATTVPPGFCCRSSACRRRMASAIWERGRTGLSICCGKPGKRCGRFCLTGRPATATARIKPSALLPETRILLRRICWKKTVCSCRGKRNSMTLVQIRLILIMAGCLRQGLSFCVWRSTGFVPAAAKVIPDFWLSAAKMPSGFPITPCLWR